MDTLYVLGEPFSISDARKAYNEYRLMFRSEADKAIESISYLKSGGISAIMGLA